LLVEGVKKSRGVQRVGGKRGAGRRATLYIYVIIIGDKVRGTKAQKGGD